MIVMVLGMHRSGTSALAGMLHKNGVVMGREGKKEFYPPPIKENPRGFYENVRFRRLNDFILKQYNYRVKSFSTMVPEIYAENGMSIGSRAESLIKEYNAEFPIWGWKDPRTSLTAPVWFCAIKKLGLIEDTRIILMKRDHCKIADSMKRRGNREGYEDQFRYLAAKYYNRIDYYLYYLGFNLEILKINFEKELLGRTASTCALLSLFLRHPITDYSHIIPSVSKAWRDQV